MDVLEPFKDLLILYGLVKQVQGLDSDIRAGVRWVRNSDKLQDSIAYVRVKARSTVFPTIVERLDDGTNPEQQHLRIDMAIDFPQERIDNALCYRASQSVANLFEQILILVLVQALRDAAPGDERTIHVSLEYLDNAVAYDYEIHGQVGGDWSITDRSSRHLHIGQIWRKARQIQRQYLDQVKRRSKARQKQ